MKIIPHDEIIKKLDIVVAACNFCVSSCLAEENVQDMAKCIAKNIDCAEICATTAHLMARNSVHYKHMIKECIEVCELCAKECGQHSAEHCKACAQACSQCADTLRQAA